MTKMQDKLNRAKQSGKPLLAVLVDPDKLPEDLPEFGALLYASKVDVVLIGGSLLFTDEFDDSVRAVRSITDIPVIIFPGHPTQVSKEADGILLLSLISGRNAELLIGQHVHAAVMLKKSGLEIMPTGYILVDGGQPTTVSYISNTTPIPRNKPGIAMSTALAGEQLGLSNIYLEAGSGAQHPVPISVIRSVVKHTSVPVIVGGGIRDAETARKVIDAGADVIVIGSALEADPSRLEEIAKAVHDGVTSD